MADMAGAPVRHASAAKRGAGRGERLLTATDLTTSALPLATLQLVELARALSASARLLILDEPTAALNDSQSETVHTAVRRSVEQGAAAIYVSHRLGEVLDFADTITVLRDGRVVGSSPAGETSVERMMADMAGAPVRHASAAKRGAGRGERLLTATDLTTSALPRAVNLSVRSGEIVGIAGLAGAGKSELLCALFGLDRPTGGRVVIRTADGQRSLGGASDAVRAGIGYLGEDRKLGGIFAGLPVRDNVMVPGSPVATRPGGLIDRPAESALFSDICERAGIRAAGADQPIEQLSGGNQQKALLGRWLCRQPRVLLLDEPTRGVDVRTKHAIYDLLFGLAGEGVAIVFASAELEEQQLLADRVVVMSGRTIVAAFERGGWTETELLGAAFSAHTGMPAIRVEARP